MAFRNPVTHLDVSQLTGLITADQLAPGAVTAPAIAPDAVTGPAIAVGTITADKLLIGQGANLLPDPTLCGPVTAAAVAAAGDPHWSVDSAVGALCVTATSSPAATQAFELTRLPILPGDQLYLAVQYQTSTDWAGKGLALYIEWWNPAGAVVGYGGGWDSNTTGPSPSAWASQTPVTATAPAGAALARVMVQAYKATAGKVWFTAGAVRPVAASVQIGADAITAPAIAAGAIDGQLITGADIRTSAGSSRIEMSSAADALYAYGPPQFVKVAPGVILVGYSTDGGSNFVEADAGKLAATSLTALSLTAPQDRSEGAAAAAPVLSLSTGPWGATNPTVDIGNNGTAKTKLTLNGVEAVRLVQDWTTVTLASGYTSNGGSQGAPQYRVIVVMGTTLVQWRGGIGITYSSGALPNSGNFLGSALPALAIPSALRSSLVVAQLPTSGAPFYLRADFNSSGGTTIYGTNSSYLPTWMSLNGIQYPL